MNVKDKLKAMREIAEANRKYVEDWKKNRLPVIKGVLIDSVNGTVGVKEISKELDAYYDILNCRCIDIARRTIGGKPFEIICDDEAALVADPIPSAISHFGAVMLYGSLFVVRFDGKEDVESLTDEDIAHVMKNVFKCRSVTADGAKTFIALGNVDYCGGRF